MAGLAGFETRNLNRRVDPRGRFFERDLQIVAQVAAALGAAAAAAAEEVAEDATEDILESGEGGRIESPAGGRRHTGVAEPVVARALFTVRENRVGLGGLLELLFGSLDCPDSDLDDIEGRASGTRFDLRVSGILRNAEDLVVIPFAHAFATFTMAGRISLSPIR